MPTLLIRITPNAAGEVILNLPRQIRAQKMVLNKVFINKDATNAAATFLSIEIPQLFHECINVGSKNGCFCIPLDKDSKFENLDFALPFGTENLPTVLRARLYDYQNAVITNTNHIKDVFLYFSYTTNELF